MKKNPSKNKSDVTKFVLKYIILMAIFFAPISFVPLQKIFDINNTYSNLIAMISSKFLNIIGLHSVQQGRLIILPNVTLKVVYGCNGLDAAMIYAVAVIAFPAHWKKKLYGIILGSFVIQIINIIRIIFLSYYANSGVHLKKYFDYIHLYAAQGLMIAISLGIFFIYLRYAQNTKQNII